MGRTVRLLDRKGTEPLFTLSIALLKCLHVGNLPAINTAHWLKCDPGQQK